MENEKAGGARVENLQFTPKREENAKPIRTVVNDFNWKMDYQLQMIEGEKPIKIGWLYIKGNLVYSEANFSEEEERIIYLHKCAFATFTTKKSKESNNLLQAIVYTGNSEDCLEFTQKPRRHDDSEEEILKSLKANNIPYTLKQNTSYESDEEYR